MNWLAATDSLLDVAKWTFGETVSYTPKGHAPVSIPGIFSDAFVSVDPGSGVAVTSTGPAVGIKLADLPQALTNKGDKCVIRGTSYTVFDVQKDGQGGATLILKKA
jgi:hypothetical protein